MKEKKFGLFTAVAMIMGIVIGSGIFFKSDNILVYTGGNIWLGVLVFVVAAFGIVFGSLTISELAARTNRAGGIITYADEYAGTKTACAFGWFQAFVYYPALIAVVAAVAGVYLCMLFGFEGAGLGTQVLIGLLVIACCFLLNTLAKRLGGYFQNAATVIKLVPLIAIAIAGFLWGDPKVLTSQSVQSAFTNFSWAAAIGPIAFSFDGWVVATSISHEVTNAKRNLPLAMVVAPLFILLCYIAYFVGVSIMVGPENIMALGDAHVYEMANGLLGAAGAKLVLVFVTISVLGTVNGLILGFIRVPYSLGLRGMFPASRRMKKLSPRFDTPGASSWVAFGISVVWLTFHYLTQRYGFFTNSDVSEVPVVLSYIVYSVLYIQVIRLFRKGEIKSVGKGVVLPLLALVGSGMILFGGMQSEHFWLLAPIGLVVMLVAALYAGKKKLGPVGE